MANDKVTSMEINFSVTIEGLTSYGRLRVALLTSNNNENVKRQGYLLCCHFQIPRIVPGFFWLFLLKFLWQFMTLVVRHRKEISKMLV